MVVTVQKFPLRGLKNTQSVKVIALRQWTLPGLCIWTLRKGLTASRVPELQWQLTLTCRGSPQNLLEEPQSAEYLEAHFSYQKQTAEKH